MIPRKFTSNENSYIVYQWLVKNIGKISEGGGWSFMVDTSTLRFYWCITKEEDQLAFMLRFKV